MRNTYEIRVIKSMISKCLKRAISSKELTKFAFESWYYYMEGPGCDHRLKNKRSILATLEDISAQGELNCTNKTYEFPKRWLKQWLDELEKD